MLRSLQFFLFFLVAFCPLPGEATLFLKENLKRAQVGDYIVTAREKNNTLLRIVGKNEEGVTIEEITIPENRVAAPFAWKEWVAQGAPKSSSWVRYSIDFQDGRMSQVYSVLQNSVYEVPKESHLLTTLLNLPFEKVADQNRKRIGTHRGSSNVDPRFFWQPKMVVNGQQVKGVRFTAWETLWPKDGGPLSGKLIEIYLPEDREQYPSYFPYWLQIRGTVGQANTHIIDSGS